MKCCIVRDMASHQVCRLGEIIISPRVLPLLPFLAPLIPSAWLASQARPAPHRGHKLRDKPHVSPFHTAARSHAKTPSSSSADLSFFDEPIDSQKRQDAQGATFESTEKTNIRAKIDQAMDRLFSGDNSADNVRKAYEATRREDGEIVRRMKFPSAVPSMDRGRETLDELSNRMLVAPRNRRTVRSRPTVGRTVELDPARGMDFGKGLRSLGLLCSHNNVRGDLHKQRFHERPGMKRKRLKHERWQKLFKNGFAATVGRVKEMRRKGW